MIRPPHRSQPRTGEPEDNRATLRRLERLERRPLARPAWQIPVAVAGVLAVAAVAWWATRPASLGDQLAAAIREGQDAESKKSLHDWIVDELESTFSLNDAVVGAMIDATLGPRGQHGDPAEAARREKQGRELRKVRLRHFAARIHAHIEPIVAAEPRTVQAAYVKEWFRTYGGDLPPMPVDAIDAALVRVVEHDRSTLADVRKKVEWQAKYDAEMARKGPAFHAVSAPAPLPLPDVRRKVDVLTLRDGTELRGDASDLTSEGVTFYDLERLEQRRFLRAEVYSLKVKGRIAWTPGTTPAPVKPAAPSPPPPEETMPAEADPREAEPPNPEPPGSGSDTEPPPAPPAPSGPDKLVLANGTVLRGRCIASTDDGVMFEWGSPAQRRTFKATEVAKLERGPGR